MRLATLLASILALQPGLAPAAAAPNPSREPSKPNVLFLLADDLGYGGIRVPCLVRWPGRLKPGTESRQACLTMDLTASLLRLAGADVPRDRLDGIDVLRHVEEGRPDVARQLFWRARRGEQTWQAARDGSLKYVRRADGMKTVEWLFDLDQDPAERQSLLTPRPGDAGRLKQLLTAWEAEVRPTR